MGKTASTDRGAQVRSLAGSVKALWALGGIVVSVVAGLIAAAISVQNLLREIESLKTQVAGINRALSFEDQQVSKGARFNGAPDEGRCPANSVVRGVHITFEGITSNPKGSLDCVSLKP